MANETGTPSRFSNYIMKLLMESPKSQKEIAAAVGFKNPNMITMLKQGHVKLALDRVPVMAKTLGVDQVAMFKLALTQFYDDASVRLMTDLLEHGISAEERKILRVIREVAEDVPKLTEEQETALREIFKPKA
jgi:hypothetical protein